MGNRPATIPIIIFLLSVVIRIGIESSTKDYQAPAYGEQVMVARSLEGSGVFGNPYQLPTGPTAHVAPVYPFLLSLLLKITPWGTGFHLATTGISILFFSMVWASLPLCAVIFEIDHRAGVVAGLLGALDPLRHAVELDGDWDTGLTSLAFLALMMLTFHWRRRFFYGWTGPMLGAAWGLMLLLQPSLIVVIGPLALLALGYGWRNGRTPAALRSLAGFLGAMVIVLAPWLIRNDLALGGPTFIRSNFGLELDISNNDQASPDLLHNLHLNQGSNHPDVNVLENRRMAEMGELSYYHQRLTRALDWIRTHPSRFMDLTRTRMVDYWFPLRRSARWRAVEVVITLAAFAGLALLLWERTAASLFLLSIWISQPVAYYAIQADERYRAPIEWSIALCAGYAAMTAHAQISRSIRSKMINRD